MSLSPESNTEVPTPIMTDLQDIASMIQINEEATVSRTVMHAEGVRLVLFSSIRTRSSASTPPRCPSSCTLSRVPSRSRPTVAPLS